LTKTIEVAEAKEKSTVIQDRVQTQESFEKMQEEFKEQMKEQQLAQQAAFKQ
jgi:FtsZ-binding cell division protein ZapB